MKIRTVFLLNFILFSTLMFSGIQLLMADDSFEGKTCEECHTNFKEFTFRHPAIEENGCENCHVQGEKKNENAKHSLKLAEEGNKLCFTCHSDIEELANKENVHPAVSDNCLNCHDPHGSKINKYLYKAPINELCITCHDNISPVSFMFHVKGKVTCNDCHAVKGNTPKLLNNKNICVKCHTATPHAYAKKHIGFGLDKNLVDGSDSSILDTSSPEGQKFFCYTCHTNHFECKDGIEDPEQLAIPVLGHFARFMNNFIEKIFSDSKVERNVKNHDKTYTLKKDLNHNALCLNCHDLSNMKIRPFMEVK